MKRYGCFFLFTLAFIFAKAQVHSVSYSQTGSSLHFDWDLAKDVGRLFCKPSEAVIWTGSLLPAWWISLKGKKIFVKASLISLSPTSDNTWTAALKVSTIGRGELNISLGQEGLRFDRLTIQWLGDVPALVSMYFGATRIEPAKSTVTPGWDRPFVPDWQATGFCVPGAREGLEQSYFRSWDFGNANIALGSFGPSMGSPYGAAYPRPVLFAGMGNNDGFIALGCGSIPDAAMSLRILGARGCFELVYNEDIWGVGQTRKRTWKAPLRLSIAENAWQAFDRYYSSFPAKNKTSAHPQKAAWNTWGNWAQKQYITEPIAKTARDLGAELFVLDGSWEASMGSAKYHEQRFPFFLRDAEAIRSQGMDLGIWQSIGWITDPFAEGLTDKDLLLNKYGKPCKANWNFDPFSESYFCLDPSSALARKFLVARTERLMKMLHPALLKLDFGYGLPSPAMAVPRDPSYRGEKYAFELVKIISDAARRMDPDISIMYYSISPLWSILQDVVSLDDQGDLWYGIKDGHASWSIWASLLGSRNIAINGSSGYNWEQDEETILNTCVIGVPGSVLPVALKDSPGIYHGFLNRRLAVNSWFRKTVFWKPLWLNSRPGNFSAPPVLNCWGRLETKDTAWVLTALVLRTQDKEKLQYEEIRGLSWTGRWALIAQDTTGIFSSCKLAVIPFDTGSISIPRSKKPRAVTRRNLTGIYPFTAWNWSGAALTIQVNSEALENTAGFLIE